MKISVIHPSRNRPERARKVYDTVISNAHRPDNIEYILSIDDNDSSLDSYTDSFLNTKALISIANNNYCVGAINKGASISNGDLLLVVSDDFDEFPKGWDTDILQAVKDKEFFMLKIHDGSQGWIATMPIMDRKLYDYLGYIYYPEYNHMFADTDLSSICDYLGCTIYKLDITIKHNHYTKLKNKDEVNVRNDNTWNQGESLYLDRYRNNFGLKLCDIKGHIQSKAHLNWIKTKLGK